MKPNFALSLSFDGIRLLHRAAGGWRLVGEVALDAPDMASELAVLRRTASSLEPGGVRSKLLVPNEQIKYLTINTPNMDDAARLEAAKAALDGATPYAVDDLAFDISVDSNRTHIAAVAHETLAEAEAFAVEHRFHPISFAAIPDNQPYLGEPYFGPTEGAGALLDDGDSVEPDGIAVVAIEDLESATPLDGAPEDDAPEDDSSEETEMPLADAAASDETLVDDAPKGETPDVALEKTDDVVADDADNEIDVAAAKSEPKVAAPSVADGKVQQDTKVQQAVSVSAGTVPPSPAMGPEKTGATVVSDKAPTDKTAPMPAPDAKPDVAAPSKAPSLGAASRTAPSVPPTRFASRRHAGATSTDQSGVSGTRREPSLGAPKPNAAADAMVVPGMSVSDPSVPGVGGAIKPDSSSLAPHIPDAVAPAPKAGFLSRRKAKPPAKVAVPNAAIPAVVAAGTEAERMTVFGARRKDVGGKPRFLGLILTAALLIFLAGVAAWASVFLDDGVSLSKLFGERTPRVTASIPDPPKEEMENLRTASLEPGLTEEDTAVLDALREPVEPPVETVTEAEAEAKYAATGIWPRAPQVPPEPAGLIDIEDLYMTSIDPVSTSTDAVALPTPNSFLTDAAFGSVSSPASAGTAFAYDTRGLIIPTVQGALSPDGFTVFLGRPTVVPVGLPDRSAEVVAELEPTPIENAALAKARPRLRPDDLAETTERAQLDGLTRSELAGYRPALRPASVQQQAAAAEAPAVDTPTVDTSGAVAAALSQAPAPAIENATKFAVRASLRPDTRPRNFARIVKRAQRAPAQETQVASVAPKVVTPKIPTKTSVARQATVKNALNLRKVNLIGVYGKPSSRRALIRLGNGRYKKVVVGDRIDGGRVSAIGDGELRYTKRGRSVVLKMPKG